MKNHRKHLYSKLGISSQSELFHLFVNHLLGTELGEPPAGAVPATLVQQSGR